MLNDNKSESSTGECNVGEKKIPNGEKYPDAKDHCKICKCVDGEEKECKEVTECSQMSCLQENEFEKKCCEEKKCKGKIYLLIEKHDENIVSLGNTVYYIIAAVTLVVGVIIGITAYCCLKGCCNTCRGE